MLTLQFLMSDNLWANRGFVIYRLSVNGKVLVGLVTRSSLMINPDILGSLDVMDLAEYVTQVRVKKMMIRVSDVVFTEPFQPIELAAKQDG